MDTFYLNLILFPLTMALFFLMVFLGGYLVYKLIQGKGKVIRALNMILFSVSLPKASADEKSRKPFKEVVAVMEQFYSSLSNLKEGGMKAFLYGQPIFSFEIAVPHVGEEICFYVACPKRFKDVMEKQIHGFFPSADVHQVLDYNIFNPQGVSLASYILPTKGIYLPFKTYQSLEMDALSSIVNALSKLEMEGEGAAIQLIISPLAEKKWRKMARKIAQEMQRGRQYDASRMKIDRGWFIKLLDIATGSGPGAQEIGLEAKPVENTGMSNVTPLNTETIKAIEAKATKIAFDVNLNLVVSDKEKVQAEGFLLQLESSFAQFNSESLNTLKSIHLAPGRKLKKLFYGFSFRIFDDSRKFILSVEELASLFHFPTTEMETPKVKFIKAKQSAAPANSPKEGLIIGRNIFRGEETVIKMQRDDRRRHLYIIGQTGTGKTNLMKTMIPQDIKNGEGIGIVDPHGEFTEYALGVVPKERAEDVIYFNPADMERPMGLNMLEYNPAYPEQKTFVVNEMMGIFNKLFDMKIGGGAMFEQYFRNSAFLVMEDPESGSTLLEITRVLADKEFRDLKLSRCKNPIIKQFWVSAEQTTGDQLLANFVPYISSKFDNFISNDIMRPVVLQQNSVFNFRKIMDEKKILLVNLSKGRLGDINANLIGLVLVGKIQMAALSRVDMFGKPINDFYLYMDEFQNVTTDSVASILSEARKYRLSLNIAHQYITQLEDNIKNAVFGNVGSMAVFRVGTEDATFLEPKFKPIFSAQDITKLDNYNAYMSMLVNGQKI